MIELNIVASIIQNNVIGIGNNLAIKSIDDLRNFYKITSQEYPEGSRNILIMGYNTWLSIPEQKRPLKNRMNLILTRSHSGQIQESDNVKCFPCLFECVNWCKENQTGRIFVIGGENIYDQVYTSMNDKISNIYLTNFEDYYIPHLSTHNNIKYLNYQMLFDRTIFHKRRVESSLCEVYTKNFTNHFWNWKEQRLNINYLIYQSEQFQNKGEIQYLNLLRKIMEEGIVNPSRNSNTLSLFGEKMEFDMKDGFPLLTSKKMGYKTILRELLWFIQGSTSNHELQKKNVHIWDLNSTREFLDSRGLDYEEGDLGPVYGFQWRHSGAEYKDCHTDYKGLGIDQLQNVIDLIQKDPHSRRIIMNAWNPSDLDKMALPPCHVMCQFHVNTHNNTLNCQLYQRSGDMFLGVPFNIASYSFLLHIISKITGYVPGKLIHILGDTHIYEEHLDAVNEQLSRVPVQFPELEISDDLTDIDSLDESMFCIKNYKCYEKITAPMIA